MKSLIAVILTKNEEGHIAACIESVHWADSVVVFDSFSTDRTIEIAQECGAQIVQHAFENYSAQREAALRLFESQTDWLFFIDADERSSAEQAAEMRAAIAQTEHNGFWIPRHNYIFGRLTRGAGWYPDHQLRLLRARCAHYDLTRDVHEIVLLDGTAGYLNVPLVHHNYRDVRQFHEKQRRYTAFAAQELFKQGVRAKPHNYFLQPLRHFRWRYLTLGGYCDGLHGLRLSLLMAYYEWRKYVLLGRLWRETTQVR
ncbi:MAG: glycosyltransferase family 2 protein [Candidatus Thermofonsia Clade 1 bacterium]|uniref:Glycosyltransferase family 2 protein n=1 Tax=Candidatus Thermofonsia Clade 1 bacterium TaxID=2364210 RepID=A0A2M8P2U7_9CHLR|nr:MAG: glycosyltransferase family 2 protein [Candidatus Thermofonsia Clade 1 bacterium]